jgi:hypothetical protein
MNAMFKMTLAGVIAALSVTVAISGTPGAARVGGDSHPVSPNHGGYNSCGYRWHPGCPSGSVTGTNKQTCKQNGEGCLKQK